VSFLRVGAGLSTDLDPLTAAAEAATEAAATIGGEMPNLVVAFVADEHRDAFEDVAALLNERFAGAAILACTAQGVVGGSRELESGPAVSVWAGFLPDTTVQPFALDFVEVGDGEGEYSGWPEQLSPDACLLMLCDRFSFPAGHLLDMLNRERPGTRVIGGVASGGNQPDEARLLIGADVRSHGAVGVAISGRVRIETIVSQGCRPLGEPMTVTRADRNIIFELGGKKPIDQIGSIWRQATPRDRGLMAHGPLHIGRVIDEYKTDFSRGDFLIRTVVGADQSAGIIAVNDVMEVGETVQFHVRDPDTADEDLQELLDGVNGQPSGVMMFTCNGRGTNMFELPDHDAGLVSKILGVPLAGFMCAGELGPIGGRNFLHGFTASLAVFVDSAA